MNKQVWKLFHKLTSTGTTNKSHQTRIYEDNNTLRDNDTETDNRFAQPLGHIHQTHQGDIFDNNFKEEIEHYITTHQRDFTPLAIHTPEPDDNHPLITEISKQDILKALKNCKTNSASGEDNISYSILKKAPEPIINTLVKLFNNCIQLGYYPKIWKKALGVMIPKPEKDPKICTNYRPISLLSCIGKLFEKIITNRILKDLESRNFFNKWQRAYRNNKEGIEHIIRFTEHINLAVNKGWYAAAILLDVEKAFDSVWHDGLRFKLKSCNFTTKLTRLLSSYITDREIKVKITETISDSVPLQVGTPQGSVLSPLLFLIYVNDLPDTTQAEMSQFVNDLGLWTSDKKPIVVERRLID